VDAIVHPGSSRADSDGSGRSPPVADDTGRLAPGGRGTLTCGYDPARCRTWRAA
jgi:hypothetical protein